MKIIISGCLLIGNLFLSIMHLTTKASLTTFSHPYYEMEYEMSTFFYLLRCVTAPIIYMLIHLLNADLSRFKGINILWFYFGYELWNVIDYVLFYNQTPFRQPSAILLIGITAFYMWRYAKNSD